MTSRRNKFEIIKDILKIANQEVGITAIIYKANLNHKRAKKYLSLLEEKGFMSENNKSRRKFKITKKGKDFLEKYREIKGIFED